MTKQETIKKDYTKYYSLVLFVFAFLMFANTINHDYAYDDYSLIVDNHVVKQGTDGIGKLLKTSYRYGYWNDQGTLYRPISLVMFALEWEMSPENPQLSHIVNVILFALLCVLLYKVILLLFKADRTLIPLIAALLFVVHPIHTEVVANIKSRDEILSVLFGLLQIFYFIKYWDQGRKVLNIVLSVLFFALSMGSKESSILFPVFLIFGVFMFRTVVIKRDWILSIPFIAVFAIYLMIRSSVIGGLNGVNNVTEIDNFLVGADTSIVFIANAFQVLGVYLFKLLIPYNLICDASISHFEMIGMLDWKSILPLGIFIGILGFTIRWFKTKPVLSFAGIVFLSSILFISNLFFLTGTSYGERLLFVPSIGVVIAMAFLFNYLYQKPKLKKYLVITMVGVLTTYGVTTLDRNQDWGNNIMLYEADIKKAPESARLNTNLAMEYIKSANENTNGVNAPLMYTKAEALLLKAIDVYPDYFDAYERLAMVYYKLQREEEAILLYMKALELNPDFANAYSNMGIIYFNRQNYSKAIEVYTKAVELNPRFADGHQNLASAYGASAQHVAVKNMLLAESYLLKAVQHFQMSLEIEPSNETVIKLLQLSQQQYGQAKMINEKAKAPANLGFE